MDRIMIFIDNSNIFKGFRKYNLKVDYEKLKNILTKNRKLEGVFLYEGAIYPISPEKKKWYEDLSAKSGYEVKVSFDKIALNDAFEKKVDIQIAIDIISFAYEDAYDIAILVSGDGDFLPVIKKLKELNKKIEIWAFSYSLANALKVELGEEEVNYLDDILSKIKME